MKEKNIFFRSKCKENKYTLKEFRYKFVHNICFIH